MDEYSIWKLVTYSVSQVRQFPAAYIIFAGSQSNSYALFDFILNEWNDLSDLDFIVFACSIVLLTWQDAIQENCNFWSFFNCYLHEFSCKSASAYQLISFMFIFYCMYPLSTLSLNDMNKLKTLIDKNRAVIKEFGFLTVRHSDCPGFKCVAKT